MKLLITLIALFLTIACSKNKDDNPLDKLDPLAPSTEKELEDFDKEYEAATGKRAHLPQGHGTCYQFECPVYAIVDKETQTMSLYMEGELINEWEVSTGMAGYETPNFDKRPDGRIYDAYTSAKYPGGNFEGLGNMPYAVFIKGGYAIHGTGKGNWKRLGNKASHGCIRLHPDNAKTFNQLVRTYGVANVWITVQ